MSSITEVEKLLLCTRKSLAVPPRNAYEVDNVYLASMERLKEARKKLSSFTGDYVERLLRELDEVEVEVNKVVTARLNQKDRLLEMDFNVDEAEDDVDEVAVAERMLEKKREAKKKQSGRKTMEEKTAAKSGGAKKKTFPGFAGTAPPPQESVTEGVVTGADETEFVVVARFDECNSSEVPREVIGPGRCSLVPGTPLARLDFTTPVDYDGVLCQCRVTLFRVVVTALTYGAPLSTNITEAASANDSVPHVGSGETECLDRVLYFDRQNNLGTMSMPGGKELGNMEKEVELEEEALSAESDDSVTDELSRKLVAEYDAIVAEKEEKESCSKFFPADVPSNLSGLLRSFSFLPWVILMCHGGYFAGGVFVDGKPVVHKAFQRYVVRKKQGGKQSSNEKDGGSYNSIGSQIRRAQEIRWKVDVRDILLSWRHYIDAAAIILYVAPGPQNRAVLMDFSGLPATFTGHDKQTASPVNLKDPRVHRAPLTTHRPNFQEVQRIYSAVSTCTVEYLRALT